MGETEVTKVTMVDDYTSHEVEISKTDILGKELSGARLEITGKKADGSEIEKISWTSGAAKKVSVKPGTYTLTEVGVPEGYVQADPDQFYRRQRRKSESG